VTKKCITGITDHRHGDKNITASVLGKMELGKMESGEKLGKTEPAKILWAEEGAHAGSGQRRR